MSTALTSDTFAAGPAAAPAGSLDTINGSVVSVIVNHDKCIAGKGCRVCIDVCPTDILALDTADGKVKMVYDECWYCLPCVHDCPTQAITVEIPYLLR